MVVESPFAGKFVIVWIVPRLSPCDITVELMFVIINAELKGFLRSTVTCVMLFCFPVVSRTEGYEYVRSEEREVIHTLK